MLFNINPNLNFWIASCSAVIFLLLLWQLREVKTDALSQLEYSKSGNLTLSDAITLFRLPRCWALIVFVTGVSVYNVYDQQFPVYFASLFSDVRHGNEMNGFLNSFQVFLGAGERFLAPFFINKMGGNGLLLSELIMALRLFGSGPAADAVTIFCMKLLHAVELPILLIAMFNYITTRFDPRLYATLYRVGFQFITQVCASVLSPLAGHSYNLLAFADTYMFMGMLVLVLTLRSIFLLTADKSQTPFPDIKTYTSK